MSGALSQTTCRVCDKFQADNQVKRWNQVIEASCLDLVTLSQVIADQESIMLIVNMLDVKTHLSKLVAQIESGEVPEVIIARNGKPAAKLVRFAEKLAGKRIGIA